MFRSLLVPVDGSAFGEQALPLALSIARRAGAQVQLLHVHTPMADVHPEFVVTKVETWFVGEMKTRQRAYLDNLVERCRQATGLSVSHAIKTGSIASTIRDHVASSGIDLVVMTTHGRGAAGRFWLGSVADELVRESPVPLLLVHPGQAQADLSQAPALKRFLVTLDGSEFAARILGQALPLGQLFQAEYQLFQAIAPVKLLTYGPAVQAEGHLQQPIHDQLDQFEQEARHKAQQYLEHVAGGFRSESVRVTTKVVAAEQPAAAILEEAKGGGVDLIALQTHGRRGLSRFILGSVADKVIRGATVPVLIQRPPAG